MKIGLWSVKSQGNVRDFFSLSMSGNPPHFDVIHCVIRVQTHRQIESINFVKHSIFHFVLFYSDPHAEPSADPDATLDEDEPEQDGGLLSGRCFTVAGFADEHVEHLWQMIEGNGGKRARESQTADFAIFPMNTCPDDNMQAKHSVSKTTLPLIIYYLVHSS